jgi:flagellar biosynthesis GTPase FlhF
VVEAPTLKEALRLVRSRYGEDARVIRSRTLTRRQPGALGKERVVEVLVEPSAQTRGRPTARPRSVPAQALASEIAAEVERIEGLVRQIAVDQAGQDQGRQRLQGNPVAEALVQAGADPGVVVRLCDRCLAETGADARDRTALVEYLTRSLPTGRGGWAEFAGTHVFLGSPGAGRTEMVLAVAGHLAAAGRQVLVLSILPRHTGEVRRLQAEAARHGYDAAVIQKPRQLATAADHLERYDVVLMDAPAFGSEQSRSAELLRREITQNPAFHRHLVFPLDRDLRDSKRLIDQARAWNCDWLVLSRVDQTGLRGKILDLLDRLPLPVSLVGDTEWPEGAPRVASSGLLADLILAAARTGAQAWA